MLSDDCYLHLAICELLSDSFYLKLASTCKNLFLSLVVVRLVIFKCLTHVCTCTDTYTQTDRLIELIAAKNCNSPNFPCLCLCLFSCLRIWYMILLTLLVRKVCEKDCKVASCFSNLIRIYIILARKSQWRKIIDKNGKQAETELC